MKISIEKTNGKWLVNGKKFGQLNHVERSFMDAFFRETKLGTLPQEAATH